ncbi:hypothetical protein ABIA06_006298 [Bradyrhizobium yuanmingense]
MELFRAEKVGEIESRPNRKCRFCGRTLRLLKVVHFPDREKTLRSFECECGDRTWDD